MLVAIAAGIFGLLVGSFLNVLILRWQTGMTFGGRSQCFSCAKKLAWYELIPVFSYFALRGRCGGCKSTISWQYPAVELASGILTFGIILQHGLTATGVLLALAGWFLIAMSVYDLMHMILPDAWTGMVALIGVVGQVFAVLPIQAASPVWLDWIAGFVFAAPFLVLWLVSKGRSMGFGDVKLMVALGLLLGWSLGLSAILLAFWIGASVSLVWLVIARRKRKEVGMQSPIPFGPFLALGAMIMMLCPQSVVQWII